MNKGIYVKEDDQDWGSSGMNNIQPVKEVLVHKHLIVRAEAINPPMKEDTELKDISGGMSVEKNRLKDLIIKNSQEKEKQDKEKLLLKTRKEVDINKGGSGYTIKSGVNAGKTLAHIQIPTKNI